MSDRPVVSVVRSAGDIRSAVERAVGLAGGLAPLVNRGEKIYLKPNFVAPRGSCLGVTTDLEVIRAVAEEVRRHGGIPVLYETPAIEFDRDEVFRVLGVPEFARKNGILLAEGNAAVVTVDVPGGRTLKRLKIPRALEHAKIINIPKLKTHVLAVMTCAIKNLIGLLPDDEKRRVHVRGVHRAVADLAKVFRPIMTVVDAVNCLEGDGPTYGDPVDLGLVIAGREMVAVDTVCSRLIGLKMEDVAYLRQAGEGRALGDIRVVGESLDAVARPFRTPDKRASYQAASWLIYALDIPFSAFSSKSFPGFLYGTGRFGTNPRIDRRRCDQCGDCRSACPVEGALDIENYRVDHKLCLRCLNCVPACRREAILVKGVSKPRP